MSARAHGGAVMNNDKLKQQICDALAAWIRQRPGLEFGNYGDVTSYRADARSIARDKRDAETLLVAVRNNSAITVEMILAAAKHSFSGRLEIKVSPAEELPDVHGFRVDIDYTTGAYWCTEYRKAAAAVLAGALWSHMGDSIPADGEIDGQSPGDWLRNRFRKEFGSKLQRRWFN